MSPSRTVPGLIDGSPGGGRGSGVRRFPWGCWPATYRGVNRRGSRRGFEAKDSGVGQVLQGEPVEGGGHGFGGGILGEVGDEDGFADA